MVIGIDFDGTCVTHEFPIIGKDIGAQTVLKDLVKHGHKLVLFTMRSEHYLDEAVKWFEDNNIPLYGINTNPTQKRWTTSPKAHANLYIDDLSLGVPLTQKALRVDNIPFPITPDRPYVDWVKVRILLQQQGILPHRYINIGEHKYAITQLLKKNNFKMTFGVYLDNKLVGNLLLTDKEVSVNYFDNSKDEYNLELVYEDDTYMFKIKE